MRKDYFAIFALFLMLTFTACENKPKNYDEIKKITDYLYEMEYTDFDESIIAQESNSSKAFLEMKAACSSVRNGDFHGRNLDLFYNNSCEIVVRLAKGENRLKSLAVCGAMPSLTPEVVENMNDGIAQKLPVMVMDGINEKGVVFNVNVVPGDDTAPVTGTNPGKENLSLGVAGRYILNHAESAKHAIELLQNRNMLGSFGPFIFHYMISDPKETYIVEFIDNKLVYYRGEPVSDSNIMTNLFSTKLPEITPHSEGVERYALLKEHYAEGSTLEGMSQLMQRVKYTLAYDRNTNPFWYSEFVEGNITNNSPKDSIMAHAQRDIKACERHERDGSFWHTQNTSVYDIKNRSLRLYVQEDYVNHYDFKLDK